MKISEMTNDQATEALIRVTAPISRICDDEEMVGIMDDLKSMDSIDLQTAIGKLLPKIVTYALKKHKDDLYEIIGALQMMPTAKVGEMNFAQTIKAVKDSYDDILSGFFTPSVPSQKRTGKE